MKFASIGSGSSGNGLVVVEKETKLLLDCGFGLRDVIHRLQEKEINPDELSGILITHEHEDHASGAYKLASKYQIPVWMTYGTHKMISRLLPKQYHAQPSFQINIIESHEPIEIGDIEISPFPVPHDAREPVQYIFSNGQKRLGVLTDTGCSTPHIEMMLSQCHALVLECNHDLDLLMQSNYPWSLKQRVSGRLGHLDNQTAGNILRKIDTTKLQHIIAAHLSEKNNSPDIAKDALSKALECEDDWIGIADQNSGFDWREIL